MDTIDRQKETRLRDRSPTKAWIRLTRGAAVAMVVWAVALQGMVGTVIPVVAVIGVAFLAFAWFLTGERRRLGLVTAVFAVLVYAGNLPVVLAELGRPDSAPSFILTLLATLAVVVAVVSGLGAFRGWETKPIRLLVGGAVAILVVGTAFSLVAAARTPSDTALATDAVVTISGMQFDPVATELSPGLSGVWVDNRDPIPHTFTVESLGIDLEVPAFTSRRIDIAASDGTYHVICLIPGHEAMTATLTVGG